MSIVNDVAMRFCITTMFVVIVSLLFNCSSKNAVSSDENQVIQEYKKIEALQSRADSLFSKACLSGDTVSAAESLSVYLRQDPLIDSVVNSEQGIAIQYENGMRGGFFLFPKEDTLNSVPVSVLPALQKRSLALAGASSKKARFMVVRFVERRPQTQSILAVYNTYLPMAVSG